MENELIKVVQLPVLSEQIRGLREQIKAEVETAKALAVTEETLVTVKDSRARLRKQFAELEAQKKRVREQVFASWDEFCLIYEECVSTPYKEADADLKAKITSVEGEIKGRAEEELRDYFVELCAAYNTQWLTYERAAPKLGLAEARQKTLKKAKDQLREFVERVAKEEEAISKMEHAPEIMAEYAQCLDMAQSVSVVKDRFDAVEWQKQALEAQRTARETERAVIEAVEAAAGVEPLAPPTIEVAPERLTVTFTVTDTRQRLIALRDWMKENGYSYK